MRAKLISIGNSKGVRIPKAVIEQCGLGGEVELEVSEDRLIVQSPKAPRQGWAAAFARMAARGDDKLLMQGAAASHWDEAQWKW